MVGDIQQDNYREAKRGTLTPVNRFHSSSFLPVSIIVRAVLGRVARVAPVPLPELARMSSKHDAKIVILGASGVGKTCLGLRFVKDQFVSYTASTIGASFLVKEVSVGNEKITLQIWDTAGQERFRSMAPLYYRGAVAAILVFSITDEASFAKLQEWVRELQGNVEEPLVLAIACNKADLTAQRTVSYDTASQYAASIGALIFETSAKRDTGAHPEPQPYAGSPCTHRARPRPAPAARSSLTRGRPRRRRVGALPRGGAAASGHQVPPRRRARRRGAARAARPDGTAR